eukprot:CAMPEP_0206062928 /NCGR_PEP_ID=MMETSP1466-20131121/57972_1 /ASSEMBLY_ACC=CAM_ASM_001126 /TAXON_ID=44452 /ORGANISM="Pavlova gyrans, Strain CCMP608" /LENGTH=85 /DNA_ID=CAMNT_0053438293 /DNA_START=702 /DNA_END=959 /DNA_ORIENTATION=+
MRRTPFVWDAASPVKELSPSPVCARGRCTRDKRHMREVYDWRIFRPRALATRPMQRACRLMLRAAVRLAFFYDALDNLGTLALHA